MNLLFEPYRLKLLTKALEKFTPLNIKYGFNVVFFILSFVISISFILQFFL